MELSGEQQIDASQQDVWRALNDPAVLRKCIPGCESIESVGPDEFKIAMLAAVGPVKARFTGRLAISNAVPLKSYELGFQGSGGVAGFGSGTAAVGLSPKEGGTLLRYTATAQVGGKVAQVGARLIDGVARKMAADFFKRFNAEFSTQPSRSAISGAELPVRQTASPIPVSHSANPEPVPSSAALPLGVNLVTPLWVVAACLVVADLALIGIFLRL